MGALADLVDEAADLNKYDENGVLHILSRPENDIDLNVVPAGRYYVGEAAGEGLRIRYTAKSRALAVEGALGGLLDAMQYGLGSPQALRQ